MAEFVVDAVVARREDGLYEVSWADSWVADEGTAEEAGSVREILARNGELVLVRWENTWEPLALIEETIAFERFMDQRLLEFAREHDVPPPYQVPAVDPPQAAAPPLPDPAVDPPQAAAPPLPEPAVDPPQAAAPPVVQPPPGALDILAVAADAMRKAKYASLAEWQPELREIKRKVNRKTFKSAKRIPLLRSKVKSRKDVLQEVAHFAAHAMVWEELGSAEEPHSTAWRKCAEALGCTGDSLRDCDRFKRKMKRKVR